MPQLDYNIGFHINFNFTLLFFFLIHIIYLFVILKFRFRFVKANMLFRQLSIFILFNFLLEKIFYFKNYLILNYKKFFHVVNKLIVNHVVL